jgi:hypothetical protein
MPSWIVLALGGPVAVGPIAALVVYLVTRGPGDGEQS